MSELIKINTNYWQSGVFEIPFINLVIDNYNSIIGYIYHFDKGVYYNSVFR